MLLVDDVMLNSTLTSSSTASLLIMKLACLNQIASGSVKGASQMTFEASYYCRLV